MIAIDSVLKYTDREAWAFFPDHVLNPGADAIFSQWLDSLRSREWLQGRGALLSFDTVESTEFCQWCCLGILANLIDPLAWSLDPLAEERNDEDDGDDWDLAHRYRTWTWTRLDMDTTGTPFAVQLDQVGMSQTGIKLFIDLNDAQELTFPQIADVAAWEWERSVTEAHLREIAAAHPDPDS